MNLERLSDVFSPEKIEFRIGATNERRNGKEVIQKATHAFALPYVTNRAIQDRLDEVCGKENWKNIFREWKTEHQLCGIAIKINGEWVDKWDGAENTKAEPLKGGLSASMKRAAAQWGIGRYLYDIPPMWVEVYPYSRGYKFKEPPALPDRYLPSGTANSGYIADVATPEEREIAQMCKTAEETKITEKMGSALAEAILINNVDIEKVLNWAKIKELSHMTVSQYNKLMDIYEVQLKDFKRPVLDVSEQEQNRLNDLNKKMGAVL